MEYSPLCYTVGPCSFSIVYIVVYLFIPNSRIIPLAPFPLSNHKFVFYGIGQISDPLMHLLI